MRAAHFGVAHTPGDPEFSALMLPIRRTPHPTIGMVDVKVNLSATIQFGDGTPVIETLEIIKLKVTETLIAFKGEFA
jgi:hypothetical protein